LVSCTTYPGTSTPPEAEKAPLQWRAVEKNLFS